jgi:hypothetical protein
MARPSILPEWASGGTKTEPSSAKKALGWVFGERPPFDFFNWWQDLVSDWIVYLDEGALVQYGNVSDVVDNTPIDKIAFVSPNAASAADAWSQQWTKTPTQIGGVGHTVSALATDGVYLFCLSDTIGTTAYIKAFDLRTGTEEWTRTFTSTGAVTTHFFHSDGAFLVHGYNEPAGAISVYDVTDGTPVNVIGKANIVDGFSDGVQLFVATTNATYIEAFSNYGDGFGAEVLQWSDNTVRPTFTVASKITSNGARVFLGGDGSSSDNLLIYDAVGGAFVAKDDVKVAGVIGTPGIISMRATEDFLFVTSDEAAGDLVMYPTGLQVPLSISIYPGLALATNAMFDAGEFGSTTPWGANGLLTGLSEAYSAMIGAAGGAGVVRVYRTPIGPASGDTTTDDAGGPGLAFGDEWDVLLTDAVMAIDRFCYGGALNTNGDVLECRNLPPSGGFTLKRVDPTGNYRRAPLWMKVKEVTR